MKTLTPEDFQQWWTKDFTTDFFEDEFGVLWGYGHPPVDVFRQKVEMWLDYMRIDMEFLPDDLFEYGWAEVIWDEEEYEWSLVYHEVYAEDRIPVIRLGV